MFKPSDRDPSWTAIALAACLMLWLFSRIPGSASFTRGHRTLVQHVTVLDLDRGRLDPDRDLLWMDGRVVDIAAGGSLTPTGALVVDGRGLCAVPALADAAVFLSLAGRFPGVSMPSEALKSLLAEARSGAGAVLDLNADRTFIHSARALRGTLPRARFAGALFTAPGGWRVPGQTPWKSNVVEIQESEDLTAPWNRAQRFGDQAVFASVESGRDDLSVPLPVLDLLGELAHSRGLPFILQTNSARKALLALSAKPDAVLGPLFDLGEAPGLGAAMRASNCAYIPDLSCVMDAFPPEPMSHWIRGFPGARILDPAVLAEVVDPANDAVWAAHWARRGADPKKILAAAKALSDAGVTIVFGSGSGLPLVFHGLGTQTELSELLRAGLSPRQVLLAATVNSHALVHMEGGRLRPGDPADVLLVRGDPLADPLSVTHPERAFLGGVELGQ